MPLAHRLQVGVTGGHFWNKRRCRGQPVAGRRLPPARRAATELCRTGAYLHSTTSQSLAADRLPCRRFVTPWVSQGVKKRVVGVGRAGAGLLFQNTPWRPPLHVRSQTAHRPPRDAPMARPAILEGGIPRRLRFDEARTRLHFICTSPRMSSGAASPVRVSSSVLCTQAAGRAGGRQPPTFPQPVRIHTRRSAPAFQLH